MSDPATNVMAILGMVAELHDEFDQLKEQGLIDDLHDILPMRQELARVTASLDELHKKVDGLAETGAVGH